MIRRLDLIGSAIGAGSVLLIAAVYLWLEPLVDLLWGAR